MNKKGAIIIAIFIIVGTIAFNINKTYATEDKPINNKTESKLVEIKEKELNSLEDYEETYGSKSYGFTAFVLHKVQVYSIPFCFLGILVGAIRYYITGIRHLEAGEKGLGLMIAFITLAVIAQVLPLVFTVVVKFGRE